RSAGSVWRLEASARPQTQPPLRVMDACPQALTKSLHSLSAKSTASPGDRKPTPTKIPTPIILTTNTSVINIPPLSQHQHSTIVWDRAIIDRRHAVFGAGDLILTMVTWRA
ncbi:hypothetical protein BaRGS_00021130, partial [Batillaria attramentaria]